LEGSFLYISLSESEAEKTDAAQDLAQVLLSCVTKTYLSFANDKEGVSSCTLPDDIFPIFIVGLKNRKRTENENV
jgi:hypothetical protein